MNESGMDVRPLMITVDQFYLEGRESWTIRFGDLD